MLDNNNPFVFKGASKLTDDQIIDYYISDHIFTRFIRSKRNIYLLGERGTGKTMALKYNSFPICSKVLEKNNEKQGLDLISVYIPCKTPITLKEDYQLLQEFEGSAISEHFFVISIMHAIVSTLRSVKNLFTDDVDEKQILKSMKYTMDLDFPTNSTLINSLSHFFQRENTRAQKAINKKDPNAFYNDAISFSSGVMPLISCLREIPCLQDSHFSLMFDDAHNHNIHKAKLLN